MENGGALTAANAKAMQEFLETKEYEEGAEAAPEGCELEAAEGAEAGEDQGEGADMHAEEADMY